MTSSFISRKKNDDMNRLNPVHLDKQYSAGSINNP